LPVPSGIPRPAAVPRPLSGRPLSAPTIGSDPPSEKLSFLQVQLHRTREALAKLEANFAGLGASAAQFATLASRIDVLDARLRVFSEEMRSRGATQPDSAPLRARLDAQDARLSALDARLEALEEALASAVERAAPSHGEAPRDELRRIRGIGPSFARGLHAAGVHTCAAIADFTDDDVERVARQIGISSDRIRRERWVEKARAIVDSDATRSG
jgi:predicted flap endonuclease-1-like 5' DNA nuclease